MYNPFSLEDKTILVTGASSGIGRSITIECSKMGAKLIITARNKERLEETLALMEGERHLLYAGDITDPSFRKNVVKEMPVCNGLVLCAGISGHSLFAFLKEEEVKEMFDVNFNSPLFLTKEIVKKKKIASKGSIVYITSTSGIISSYIGGGLYSSTKGALNGLIKAMSLELAPKYIRVNSVMPSMIETPIMNGGDITNEQFEKDKEKYPLKRYGKPEEVAYGVIYLLSDASLWTTGTNLLLDGGRSVSY